MKQIDRSRYIYYAFFFLLPFKQQFSLWALVLLCIASIYLYFSERKYDFNYLNAWPLLLLFGAYLVSLIYTAQNNLTGGLSEIGRLSPLIILPVILGLNKKFVFNNRINFLKAFVVGNFATLIYSFSRAFYRSFDVTNGLTFDAAVIKGYPFLESVTQGGNYFFSHELAAFQHPTYTSVSVLISICSILYVYKSHELKFQWLIFFTLTFIIELLFLSSRASFLIFIVISIFILLSLKKYFIITVYMSAIIGLISLNPRLINMNNYIVNFKYLDPDTRYDFGLRLLTWDSSIEVIRQNWILGTGIGDSQDELQKIYIQKHYKYPLQKSLNSHNQFLQTFIETGSVGLIVLLFVFFKGLKRPNYNTTINLFLYVLLIFFIDFLFESSLKRYHGIILFSTFYSFMWLISTNNVEHITQKIE